MRSKLNLPRTILAVAAADPSIFFDADGKAWVVNNGGPQGAPLHNGHRAIWIQEYDVAAKKMTGPTALAVPSEAGVSAGLAVFQGERFNYFAGVRREFNGVSIFLERNRGREGQEVVKSVTLSDAKNIKLRVNANDAKCAFEYGADNGPWEILAADQDATPLTTDVAGGFVGSTVGPFVRADQNGNQ